MSKRSAFPLLLGVHFRPLSIKSLPFQPSRGRRSRNYLYPAYQGDLPFLSHPGVGGGRGENKKIEVDGTERRLEPTNQPTGRCTVRTANVRGIRRNFTKLGEKNFPFVRRKSHIFFGCGSVGCRNFVGLKLANPTPEMPAIKIGSCFCEWRADPPFRAILLS